ncbi:hypothetical protein KAR91_57635 [Candidatus Pacearchaeota archaeon]|nr:hypothetical protein [Candidatus Pacearchaeota archaeon]
MPNTIPQNKFAVACSVSRQGIASAVSAKLIAVYNKKINIDHRKTCEYYFSKTGKKLDVTELMAKKKRKPPKPKQVKPVKPAKAIKPTTPPKKPPEKITAPIDLPDNDPEPNIDPDDGYTLPKGIERFENITIHNLHLIPKDLIDKIKSFEVAAKAKQARDVSRGKLIERDIVKKVFAKIHTVDTNQWKTLEDKITPDLCSLFKAQDGGEQSIKARKMINFEVTKILKYTKRLIDEFFIENKEAV